MKKCRWLNQLERYIPIGAKCVAGICMLLIPLKIIGYGYTPSGETRVLHARMVTHKDWASLTKADKNQLTAPYQGWVWAGSWMNKLFGLDAETCMICSIVTYMALCFALAFCWSRPEAWTFTLLLVHIAVPSFVVFLSRGHPDLLIVMGLIALLIVGQRPATIRGNLTIALLSAILVFLVSAWPFLFWLGLSLLLVRAYRNGWVLLGSCLCATLVRCFTAMNSWPTFWRPWCALGWSDYESPHSGLLRFALLILVLIPWFAGSWRRLKPVLWRADVLVAIAGALLGCYARSFWWLMGLPAGMVWIGSMLHDLFQRGQRQYEVLRLAWTVFLGLALYLAMTGDLRGRWTNCLLEGELSRADPLQADWLPGHDGIVYSDSPEVFYQLYFRHLRESWRYLPGFRAQGLSQKDRAILDRLQEDPRAWQSWIARMRPQDRAILKKCFSEFDGIPGLTWYYAATELWIGRPIEK